VDQADPLSGGLPRRVFLLAACDNLTAIKTGKLSSDIHFLEGFDKLIYFQ